MSEHTFFSFRKPPDWSRGTAYQLETGKGGLSIVSEKVYRHINHFQLTHPQLTSTVLDTVADQSGRWFILDSDHSVWRFELAGRHAELVIKLESIDGRRPISLAAAGETVTVLYDGEDSMLQTMVTDRAQIRSTAKDWYGESFHARQVFADSSNGLLVIGTIGSERELQLLRFDSSGSPAQRIPLPMLDADFADEASEADAADAKGTAKTDEQDDAGEGRARLEARYHLSVKDESAGWLLDTGTQQLIQLDLQHNEASSISLSTGMKKNDMLSLCCGNDGLLWILQVADEEASSNKLIAVTESGETVKQGFTGNATGSKLFAGGQALYLWNAGQLCVYKIQPVSETAVWSAFGNRTGVWFSDALDSGEDETEWHKLVLDAERQNDTQINIRFYASDHRELFVDHQHVNLDTYLMDDTIAPEVKLAALTAIWSKPLKDPQDALLHQARGRYIWLFIELIGSAKHTPVIRSLEIHFPRQSYLSYLPSIYQRDERSSDFLSRYLSLFQTMLEDTEQKIHGVTRTLEPRHASGPSLRWLLGWLGIEAEDYWTEEQLRKLLKIAPSLYSLRGTKAAMERLIEIYTGEKPIILEYEQVKPLKENAELGEVAERLYAADPHMFNVLVKAEHADTETKRVTLQLLIESYKPVFASCKLIILQPWVYMDLHSYLGMNTVLSEPNLLQLDGRSSMPHHTITIDVGQDNRIDKHTRLGLNSRLE